MLTHVFFRDVALPVQPASVPVRASRTDRNADEDTIVPSDKQAGKESAEDTVSFGGKLSDANLEAKTDDSTDTVNLGRRSSRRTVAAKEETVVFCVQSQAGAKVGAMKPEVGATKKTALRGIKRTGLGSGPARRIVSKGDEGPDEAAEDVKPRVGTGVSSLASESIIEEGAAKEVHEEGADTCIADGGVAPTRLSGKKLIANVHTSSLSGAGCNLLSSSGGFEISRRPLAVSDGTSLDDMGAPSLTSSELTPINEGEGASSGSEGNSSISSGGSNDSVNRSVELPMSESINLSLVMSDQTTKPHEPHHQSQAPCSMADEPTQPLRRDQEEDLDLFFDDMASQSTGSKEERQMALRKGHTAQFADEDVPKGHIAVCNKIYKKIEVKGKGGGGKVYKVHVKDHPESIWAIKKIKLAAGDEELKDSVFNEIELLLRLRGHSCIIHMEDYEIGEDYVYMVMECGDQDLAQALQKRQVRSLRGVWRAMIDSVQVVHDERVVHGDLKPANFLMVKKELKLIDFGIAKSIEGNDTTNIVRDNAIGTLNYMAPEAFLGNQGASMGRKTDGSLKLGRPSDVWSMGCILYQMVYGRPPFHNLKNTVHKMQAITSPSHQIEFPSSGASGPVEPELLHVLKSTLERDPAKRPTIPQLRVHPWLVPVKYALDSYNILVMVSKVRALHKEHKDITDAQIKDELLRLMNAAGLAIQEPSPPLPPKQVSQASSHPSTQAAATRPPPPPPPPPSGPTVSKALPKATQVLDPYPFFSAVCLKHCNL